MEPQTQEDINVYEKYKQPTIDKWTEWLRNIPRDAPAADSALWYKSIGDFSRDPKVIFKDRKTGRIYISPDHFETFLKKYFPNSNSYFPLNFLDIKRKMDQEVGERLGQGGSKRKRKSKRKSQRKSKSKSKRKSNKKSKRMHQMHQRDIKKNKLK